MEHEEAIIPSGGHGKGLDWEERALLGFYHCGLRVSNLWGCFEVREPLMAHLKLKTALAQDEGKPGRRGIGVHEQHPHSPSPCHAAGLEPGYLLRQQLQGEMQAAAPHPCLWVASTKA